MQASLRFRRTLLLAESFLGGLSGSMTTFAIVWASSQYSAVVLGGTLIAGTIPGLALAFVGGALADRVDARRLLFLGSLLSGAIQLFAAVWLCWSPGALVFVVLNLARSVLGALLDSSAYVLVPALFPEEELVRTNASLSLADDAAYLFGPLLAAGLFSLSGAEGTMLVAAAMSVAAGLLLLALPAIPRSEAGQPLNLAFLGAGAAYLVRTPSAAAVAFYFAVTNLFAAAFQVATPLYAATLGGAVAYALLSSAMNLGMTASNLALSALALRSSERLIFFAGVVQGLAMAGLGRSRSLPLADSFGALNDAMANVSGTVFVSHLQAVLPEALLGRVFSAVNALAMGLTPLGFAAAPWLIDRLGAAPAIVALGLVSSVVSAVFCGLRGCWSKAS